MTARRVSPSRSSVTEKRHVAGADVENREDIGVRERGDRTRFLLEATQPRRVGGDGTWQYLEGDVAPEPRVARLVDFTHATGAERRHDFGTGRGARRQQGHQAIVVTSSVAACSR